MKSVATIAIAALLGQTQAVEVKESHKTTARWNDDQPVEVLAQSGNHIELGVKEPAAPAEEAARHFMAQTVARSGVDAEAKAKAQAKTMTEQKAVAQSTMQMLADLPPDVYGPNGDNYGNNNPSYDYSRIKIDINTPGSGQKCKPGEWTSAHWVANLMQDGRVYSDTRQEGNGEPKLFTLGGHHVINCLDIAISQLSAGAKAHIECPSFYAFGGALTQSFLKGGLPLPLHADVEYQLEVLDCNIAPVEPTPKPEPVKLGIQTKRQFGLHMQKQIGPEDLVLCCQDDEYMKSPEFAHWPGIQCYLEEYIKGDENQLWTWDDKTFFLKNVATGMYLTNNAWTLMMGDYDHINWQVAHKAFPWYAQWFEFCPYEHVLETEINGMAAYASVQPNIKLRNNIDILTFTASDTEEIIDRGVFRVQYEFKNW